jgi:Protein ChrB, N-terminal
MPTESEGRDGEALGGRWMLVAYRAPKEPSTARVAAWRRLHRLGGLYVGPSVCLIPRGLADEKAIDQIADGVRSAGGTFDVLTVDAFAAETHALLADRFNSARDAEYAEVVERAEALQAELEREGGRGKFTFAEVEENEADLAKLQRWLDTVSDRDVFGAAGRGSAEEAVREAADALQRFAERSAQLEEEALPSQPPERRNLP